MRLKKHKMKAFVYEKSNKPEVLVCREIPTPTPSDHEVLVEIHYTSVNALDYRPIKMGVGIPKKKIFGADIAGRVVALGTNVRSFSIGDAVCGDLSDYGCGGFAEYAAVPEQALVRIPLGVSYPNAVTVPVAGVTALQALRGKGTIQAGDKILIHGSGGGVGTFAVQLAKYFNAQVTAVCSTRNVEAARSLGADHIIDYSKEDFAQNGVKYDLILAVNGQNRLSVYRKSLAARGRCIMVGGSLKQIFSFLFFGPVVSLGSRKFKSLMAKSTPEDIEFLLGLLSSAHITPIIDTTFPFEETAKAVNYLGEGHARGKVVIAVK
jgi:NADPH:quinone reductase-like Zn-dependent oxidoreductase